jgi:hypothetical protein
MAASSTESLPKQMASLADQGCIPPAGLRGRDLGGPDRPHRARVYQAAAYRRAPVLFVKDQTYLDFTHHSAAEGLGVIGSPYPDGLMNRGLVSQTCLAVAPDPAGRTILGLAALMITTRKQAAIGTETKTQRQSRRNESSL